MDVLGRHQGAHHGADGAGEDLDVRPAGQFADLAGIHLGPRQRHVAGHRRDAKHLELRRGQRQQDRHGVVLAGIGVDDDGKGCGHDFSSAMMRDASMASACG